MFNRHAPLMLLTGFVIAPAVAADSALAGGDVETITVTANKLNQELQRSSTPVTLITADEIREKGITGIDDISKVLPNSVPGSFYAGVTDWNYRGLNSSVFKGNNPVIIYVDGIAQLDRRTMFVDMANVERIEIIHGPSNTVHGKGAIGGVINIITKGAARDSSAELSLQGGEHGSYDAHGFVSGALIDDKLFGKLSATTHNYDGVLEYADPSVNDENDDRENWQSYSGQLDFYPDEVSSLKLQVNHNRQVTGYGRNDIVQADEINTAPVPDKVDYNTKTERELTNDSQALMYMRDFDGLRVEAQVSHSDSAFDGIYECDYSSASAMECFEDIELDIVDAEVRLVSDERELKWVAGAFVGKQERTINGNGYRFGPMPIAYSRGTQDEDTQAVFGQVVWPMTDALELTAGMRYQRQTYKVDTTYFAAANPGYGTPEINTRTQGSQDEDALLPSLGLSYLLTDTSTVFLNYSRGFLAGGHNDFQVNPSGDASDAYYKPQYNDNIELGFRGSFDRLNLSASVFYMDIQDIHTYTIAPGALYTAGNLKGATSKGAEVQMDLRLTEHWSFDTAFGITDATYKDGSLFNGADASGKTVERTPDYTLSAGIQFEANRWLARLAAQRRGSYYYNFQNSYKVDSFTEFNARVSWKGDSLELFVYANNLTDEDGITTVFDSSALTGPGTVARAFNNPRTLGLGMNYQF